MMGFDMGSVLESGSFELILQKKFSFVMAAGFTLEVATLEDAEGAVSAEGLLVAVQKSGLISEECGALSKAVVSVVDVPPE
ncbi:hypothetical protein HPP92_028793 [Vanilla planifolia]|uniref:Uncharacterized protein n=1 Tax=Vanilla planifolia TaxID=51239 RepID=A0A835P788_VANPL|nr:hypothetical protein HPP92_028793 [Vanilla planifolia]KAG0446558.1 hypothetical protein HPP92_028782 [Vanilla planifolia]